MHTLLVWIMISTTTAFPAPHFTYATQGDCLQVKHKIEALRHHSVPYKCISVRIIDPRYRSVPQTFPLIPSAIPIPTTPRSSSRALRNYQYEQNKINQFLSPNYVPQGKLHGQRDHSGH